MHVLLIGSSDKGRSKNNIFFSPLRIMNKIVLGQSRAKSVGPLTLTFRLVMSESIQISHV